MTAIQKALLPCPFCGGPAKSAHLGGSAWFIEAEHASDCFFADFQRSEAEAVTAWNHRAAQAERMARLPATGPYVDRIIRIFRDRPDDDTSAAVLMDYARAARALSQEGSEPS